jgi:hypothetical protein
VAIHTYLHPPVNSPNHTLNITVSVSDDEGVKSGPVVLPITFDNGNTGGGGAASSWIAHLTAASGNQGGGNGQGGNPGHHDAWREQFMRKLLRSYRGQGWSGKSHTEPAWLKNPGNSAANVDYFFSKLGAELDDGLFGHGNHWHNGGWGWAWQHR